MWRFTAAAGTLVLACLTPAGAAPAAAQVPGPQFGVAVSATFPTGDFHQDLNGDGYNAGWQAMALVTARVPRSPLGFRFDATYGENSANDLLKADLTAATHVPTDSKVKLFGGNFDLTLTPRSPWPLKTYFLGGLGVYRVTAAVTSNGVTTNTSGTELAWNVGAGFSYNLRGPGLFFEVRYIDIAAVSGLPKTPYVPITMGLRF